MNIYPTAVRIRKAGAWEVLIEVPPIYGDVAGVARRMRSELGAKARVIRGEVVVDV